MQGLRNFLSTITLPNNLKKSERLLNAFARVWSEDNAGAFAGGVETAVTLTRNLILLNASLHGPADAHRIELQEWVEMHKSADLGGGIELTLLEGMYWTLSASALQPFDNGNSLIRLASRMST